MKYTNGTFPVWGINKSAWSVSREIVLVLFFPLFGSVLLLPYVFLLLKSVLPELCSFCSSFHRRFVGSVRLFSSIPMIFFIILDRIFLSVIAVKYFDNNNSAAEILLKLLSFSMTIYRQHNSSGVSHSVCSVQKKSPQL